MGWWSKDIMGGDTPLDWEDEFYGICQVEKWPEGKRGKGKISKETVAKCLPQLETEIVKQDYEPFIGYQVLGVMLLAAGANIPQPTRERIIQACEQDEWAKVDEDRRTHTLHLKSLIENYDGTPVQIESKGLFEAFAEHLNKQA